MERFFKIQSKRLICLVIVLYKLPYHYSSLLTVTPLAIYQTFILINLYLIESFMGIKKFQYIKFSAWKIYFYYRSFNKTYHSNQY